MQLPRIVVALVAFMLVMVGANGIMVWLSIKKKPDLVRPDYYDAGLEQDKIIARQDFAKKAGMNISFVQDSLGWRAEAESQDLKNAQCKVYWYRPNNGKEDQSLDMGVAQISLDNPQRLFWQGKPTMLKHGQWIARIVWEMDGKPIMEKSYPIRISG